MVSREELKNIELFSTLSDSERDEIAKCMEVKTFYKGDCIFKENKQGGVLYVIKSGEVKISKVIREGERQTFSVLGEGEYFGAVSLLDGQEHSASADVVSDCKLFELKKEAFDNLMTQNPKAAIKVMRRLIVSLCSFLRTMDEKFVDMVQYITLDR